MEQKKKEKAESCITEVLKEREKREREKMTEGDVHGAGVVLKGLAQYLNFLNEDNKSTRKKALEQIRKETVGRGLPSSVLQEVFSVFLKPLVKRLSDQNEGCREVAIAVVTEFIRCIPRPEESLHLLVPCLARRLGAGEILEPAEELRLSSVEMLTFIVEVCGRHVAPYVQEVIDILGRTIEDPFPDVKQESCRCTVKLAENVPEHFYNQAKSLINPLMQTITYQQSRVRVSVIEATGAVIQHGGGNNMEDVVWHMAQRLFDDSPQVRRAVAAVVGDWLLHLRDRYSYHCKLVPLLLSCINDQVPEIQQLASDLWKQVGAQYEKENEKDLKDMMDFPLDPPSYPPGVERPGIGCRELVVRNLGVLVPAVARDISDWLVATRVKTSQLLAVLLLHAEDHSTMHLQPLLAALYRGCTDREKVVVDNCLEAARLLGTLVPPGVVLRLLLDHLRTPPSSSHPWVPLMVLAAVLGGSSKPLLQPHLQQIADTLVQPEVSQDHQQVQYLQQLSACVDVLLCRCESDCSAISRQLLQALVAVRSLSTDAALQDKALESVQRLCEVQSLDSVPELYRRHMGHLLDQLSASVHSWSSYSLHRLQLNVIVAQSGPVVGEFVGQLMPILQVCLQPDRDPEMRRDVFTMLANLLQDAAHTLDSQGRFQEESEKFLCDVLLPNLVWRPGRAAGAVRTAALSCLLALLHGGAVTPALVRCHEERLRPHVLSALQEHSDTTRLLACRCVSNILRLVGNDLRTATLNKIYPELLKRLDDSSDEVRVVALQTLGQWLSSLNTDYDAELFSPHLRLLFQQLLLHLDDTSASVQGQVFEILRNGSSVHPTLLKKSVEGVREKLRSPLHCDLLLRHIDSLTTE